MWVQSQPGLYSEARQSKGERGEEGKKGRWGEERRKEGEGREGEKDSSGGIPEKPGRFLLSFGQY